MRRLLQYGITAMFLSVSIPCFAQTPDHNRDNLGDEYYDSVPFTDASDEPFTDAFPTFYCDLCRDPFERPMDFIGFYYNGHPMLGQGPYRDDTYYLIKITYGDRSNFVLVWTSIQLDVEGSVLFPTQLITIHLRRPDGQVSSWPTLLNQPNLMIGEPVSISDDSCNDDQREDERDDWADRDANFWDAYWADWEESHGYATQQSDCYVDDSDPTNIRVICMR